MTVKEIKAMIEGMNDDDKVEIFTKKAITNCNPWNGDDVVTKTEWTWIRKKIYIVKVEEER